MYGGEDCQNESAVYGGDCQNESVRCTGVTTRTRLCVQPGPAEVCWVHLKVCSAMWWVIVSCNMTKSSVTCDAQ